MEDVFKKVLAHAGMLAVSLVFIVFTVGLMNDTVNQSFQGMKDNALQSMKNVKSESEAAQRAARLEEENAKLKAANASLAKEIETAQKPKVRTLVQEKVTGKGFCSSPGDSYDESAGICSYYVFR